MTDTTDSFTGNPLILFVDDESLMREVASIMIEDFGGRVLLASDGNQALEIFAEKFNEIDFIYTDFSMPHLTGYEMLCEIWKIRPDVPAVIISGLDITPEVAELREAGKVGYLRKPFKETEILEAFHQYRRPASTE